MIYYDSNKITNKNISQTIMKYEYILYGLRNQSIKKQNRLTFLINLIT